MGALYRMSDFRKRSPVEPQAQPGEAASVSRPMYHCMTCDASQFKLYPDGAVHCAECDCQITNLSVADRDTGLRGSK